MDRDVQPKVVICILNWNGGKDTVDCLESVRKLSYPHFQVVVLDNGSNDDSVELIKMWCIENMVFVEYDKETAESGGQADVENRLLNQSSEPGLVLIKTRENLGFAEGNNVAIRYALRCAQPADYVFLLNNDTWIDPDCLTQAVGVSQKKRADVVGCVVKESKTGKLLFSGDHRPHHLFYVSYYWFRHELQGDEPTNMVWGTAMLVHQDALRELDTIYGEVFNHKLFLYAEDYDFCFKIKKMGYEIFLAHNALVYHKHEESCVTRKYQNSFILYYSTRNTILVAKEYLSGIWIFLFHGYYLLTKIKDLIIKLKEGKPHEAVFLLKGLKDGHLNVYGKWKEHS